jgi:hypothetical protein
VKQNRKISSNGAPAHAADTLLAEIARHKKRVELIEAAYNKEAELLQKKYKEQAQAHSEALAIAEQSLIKLMKKERQYLFAGGGVLVLGNGSLIFNTREKIRIPKNAVEKCEELGFDDAVKIIKQLDREVVEQWPHAKLVLIGADKKTVEEFGYELKRERQ